MNSFHLCPYAGLFIAGAILTGVGLGWLIFYCRHKRKQRLAFLSSQVASKEITSSPSTKGLLSAPSSHFTKSIPSYPSSKSDLVWGSSYFGVQVFSYTELEEATDKFDPTRELGDGGFGTVYYGLYATLHHLRNILCFIFSLSCTRTEKTLHFSNRGAC